MISPLLFRRVRVRFRLLRRRAWPVGERGWVWLERIAIIASFGASVVAMGGVGAWLLETRDRDLERRALATQAVNGAYETIERGRDRANEIGQSEAIRFLTSARGIPPSAIDLDGVLVQGILIPGRFDQPFGARVGMRDVSFERRDSGPPHCQTASLSAEWLVLDDIQFGAHGICTVANIVLHGVRIPENSNIEALEPSQSGNGPQSRSARTAGAGAPTLLGISLGGRTAFAAVNSVAVGVRINSEHDFNFILGSNLHKAELMTFADLVLIQDSMFTSTAVIAPSFQTRIQSRQTYARCMQTVRSKQRLGAPLSKSDSDRYAECAAGLMAKSRKLRKGTFGAARRAAPAPLFIVENSDIRGADLRAIPAEVLLLRNVCADETTRLPRGVRLAQCGPHATAFWDLLKSCKEHKFFGPRRSCLTTINRDVVYRHFNAITLFAATGVDAVARDFGLSLSSAISDPEPDLRFANSIFDISFADVEKRDFPSDGATYEGRDVSRNYEIAQTGSPPPVIRIHPSAVQSSQNAVSGRVTDAGQGTFGSSKGHEE